jgi:hypothetical protein
LYSLYDALVSIQVPADKARAVVDAMERDMGTTLATKQDLLLLATREDLLQVKQEVALLRQEMKSQGAELRQELKSQSAEFRQELKSQGAVLRQETTSLRTELRQEIENRYVLLDQKIDTLQLRMTVRLGSMLIVGFGLTIAAMRSWI